MALPAWMTCHHGTTQLLLNLHWIYSEHAFCLTLSVVSVLNYVAPFSSFNLVPKNQTKWINCDIVGFVVIFLVQISVEGGDRVFAFTCWLHLFISLSIPRIFGRCAVIWQVLYDCPQCVCGSTVGELFCVCIRGILRSSNRSPALWAWPGASCLLSLGSPDFRRLLDVTRVAVFFVCSED